MLLLGYDDSYAEMFGHTNGFLKWYRILKCIGSAEIL